MSAPQFCPECAAVLPSGAPGGLCPKCLLAAALARSLTGPGDELETAAAGDDIAMVFEPLPPGAENARPRAPVGLDEFRRTAEELGLIPAFELERFVAATKGGVPDLARALVRAGKLTPYQAGALSQGKARGLLIGNYFILDKLGAGGMGVVFKARHRRLGRIVALKILPPTLARDKDLLSRFRREVDVAARLSHPNIVSVLDANEDRGVQFMTMEYIDGNDLDRLVRHSGVLPVDQALDCVIQAARGLEAAHGAGNRSPRYQARQPHDRRLGNGPRARPRAGAPGRGVQPLCRHRDGAANPIRNLHGNHRLHGPRARHRLEAGRPPGRHLQPGLHPLLPADRPATVRWIDHPGQIDGAPGTPSLLALGGATRPARGRRRRLSEDDGQETRRPSGINERGYRTALAVPAFVQSPGRRRKTASRDISRVDRHESRVGRDFGPESVARPRRADDSCARRPEAPHGAGGADLHRAINPDSAADQNGRASQTDKPGVDGAGARCIHSAGDVGRRLFVVPAHVRQTAARKLAAAGRAAIAFDILRGHTLHNARLSQKRCQCGDHCRHRRRPARRWSGAGRSIANWSTCRAARKC